MISITSFLIVCPLIFLAGFVDAIAGGGGLISLPAYMLTGLPVTNCIATNKMSSAMGTTISTIKYAKNGYISLKPALFCIPCAFGGSAIGANIALIISDDILKIIMLVVLPLTGIYVITRKNLSSEKDPLPFPQTIIICMACAFFIGIYDGFYGPGTGTFLILLLTTFARMKVEHANGLTKVINYSTNIAALTVFIINGEVLFPLGIVAGFFGIAGNYLGAARFTKGGSKVVKPVMMIVIGIFFVKVFYEVVRL